MNLKCITYHAAKHNNVAPIGNNHQLQQSCLIARLPVRPTGGRRASHGAPLSKESGKLTLVSLLHGDRQNHS